MSQSNQPIVKERSPLYPMFSINESLDFVEDIVKIGGKKVSIETIASVIGMSTKTNSFKSKVSTAKQFGLIRGMSGTVEITELAKKIIYAVDDTDLHKAKVESFLSAPLYQKIAGRYEDRALPAADKLGNILLLEYGITKSAKDIATTKFIESAEQIGILKNGIISLESDSSPYPDTTISGSNQVEPIPEMSEKSSPMPTSPSIPSIENAYHFAIPTLSGSTAQITIPKEITSKDLDFISLYIQNMLPAFISNLREQLEE